MDSPPGLSRAGRVYLWTVVALGFLAIGESLLRLYQVPLGVKGLQWLLLAILTLVSGSASVELPRANVSISISEAFVFTAVLLYGTAAGTLTVALDGLVISFWVARRRPEFHRALFNIAAPALSAWTSSKLFFYVSGVAPLAIEPVAGSESATFNQILQLLPAMVLFAVVYFALNSWLIAFVIAFQRRVSPFDVWHGNFLWLSLNYFCGASLAVLLVGYTRAVDLRFVAVVVPLLVVLYFTFKTSTQRVEDVHKHVDELNTLYLSTIETLAMAVDAKDQVTHGHIRRVQSYATSLAYEVGVKDEKLLKAIEAAALLHDLGKLAVPEYILNKPGKLTDGEFDKIKLHASVGADILSAIAFPYPVVPIVRHHHENWNGSGYPSGLKGTDIPIGARILSVVDCFDALTSDRPYRPRLSDEDALRILAERRGTMYDPLIIDAFGRVHRAIAQGLSQSGPPQTTLSEIARARVSASHLPAPVLDEIAASADEMFTLYELARGLAGQSSLSAAVEIIAKHLRRLVPASLCVFYVHDSGTGELEARHAVGAGASFVRGLKIPLGQRLSGWVAANRQTISNSDPVLDLGDAARAHSPRLRSCMSTALTAGDALVGVLSLYSGEPNGFTDDHRRVIEVVTRQVAHALQRAIEYENSPRNDDLTGLPHLNQFEQLVKSTMEPVGTASKYALLFIKIMGLEQLHVQYGTPVADETLRHVVKHTRRALRMEDILFRNAGNDLVAFINAADADAAEVVAKRVRENVARYPLKLAGTAPITIHTIVSAACAPQDGEFLGELLSVARNRASAPESGPDRSVVH